MNSTRVWVCWCSSGCEPVVFSAEEQARKFMAVAENWHFTMSEIEVDYHWKT